jgi:hypothetical protein
MSHGGVRAFLVAAALAGCGSNSPTATPDGSTPPITDVSGWYQVTSDLAGPCGATTTDPVPIQYVWMERLQNTFYFNVCSGPTEAECTGTLFYDFITPIANGVSADGGTAFYSAGCTLSWEHTELTLVGDQLTAHSLKYSVTDTRAQEQCTLEWAAMLPAQLPSPCTYQIDITATALAAASR